MTTLGNQPKGGLSVGQVLISSGLEEQGTVLLQHLRKM